MLANSPPPAAEFNVQDFAQQLENAHDKLSLFRQAIKHNQQTLAERFKEGRTATELVPQRAQFVDEILIQAWLQYFNADEKDIALIAVGGYGRGELHPASDVDVLILLRETDEPYAEQLQSFLTFLWDIGLEIGHSVRNLEECIVEAKNDVTIITNLQEARLLIGPKDLFEAQQEMCDPDHIWPSKMFFSAKMEEQTKRHQRFNDSAYNLEPNIKESPGGLRDIQNIGWVAKRHFGADNLLQLQVNGFLTEQEYKTLHEGQAFLWNVRFGLHILTGRREDRLLFDHQRELARQFGYQDTSRRLAVEQFMKQYYQTVMELNRLNEMLLQLFKEEIVLADVTAEPKEINRRFRSVHGFLEVTYPNVFEHYPFALLEVFLLLMQDKELQGIRANTIRLIRENLHLIDSSFRMDLRNRALFMEIIRHGEGVTHVLRRMNVYGVLAEYLPTFKKIVGLMQHDLFHVYTVDEHTLNVVRNLRRFTVPDFYNEFPLCSDIMNRIPKQEILILAGLFHDIAKGRGGDHAVLGAIDAREFCEQHQLSRYDTNMVTWLVEQHLIMSSTAQRKDISDPEVIHEFAERVGDQSHLNYLYLLTVADIRATSDSVWNSWKDSLLRELYHSTSRALRRGLKNPLMQSEFIEENQRLAMDLLQRGNIETTQVQETWAILNDDYFLRYNAEEIAWHTEAIINTPDADLPLIMFRHELKRGGTACFIYSHKHPNLLNQISTVLEQSGVNIVDARITDSKEGYSLDTFIFLDHNDLPVLDENQLEIIETNMRNALQTPDLLPRDVHQHLPRQAKHFKFPTEIIYEEEPEITIMYIKAYDRPGLLSRISKAFAINKIQVTNAKIATLGERAEDIFFIVNQDGNPLTEGQQVSLHDKVLELLQD